MLFDLPRVLAEKAAFQVFHRTHERLFLVFEGAFSHAAKPFIRVHLDKNPVRAETIHHKRFNIRDFHLNMISS